MGMCESPPLTQKSFPDRAKGNIQDPSARLSNGYKHEGRKWGRMALGSKLAIPTMVHVDRAIGPRKASPGHRIRERGECSERPW